LTPETKSACFVQWQGDVATEPDITAFISYEETGG